MAARQGYARSVSKIVIFTDLRFPNSAFSPRLRSVRRPTTTAKKRPSQTLRQSLCHSVLWTVSPPDYFSELGLDVFRRLLQQLLWAAERDADVTLALRAEDAARSQEHVALVHHLVRECETVTLVRLRQFGPYEQSRLMLAVFASQRVEQRVRLLLTAVVDVVQLLEPPPRPAPAPCRPQPEWGRTYPNPCST